MLTRRLAGSTLSRAKPLGTRKDFKKGPQHLRGLKPGDLVLVLLDDQAFPPTASAKQREKIELEMWLNC